MRKIIILTLFIGLWVVAPAQSQGDLAVVLETRPPAGQIGPDNTLAQTTLSVVDANGRPLPNAYLKLHVDAPPGNAFISTDFPIVEDTPLLNYEGILPDGVLEFEYIYPIRGQYRFEVEAGREAAAISFKDTLSLTLSENRNEVINGVIFIGLLFILGIVAGLIIGTGARAQRMAAAGLAVLVIGGLVGGAASLVQAHGGDEVSSAEPFTESAANGDLRVTYRMSPGAGRVGALNTLSFEASDSAGNLRPETTFEVTFWHIEDDKPVFATTLYAPTGQTQFEFQFFDGAEHEVRLTAQHGPGTVGLAKVVEVEGISPPISTRLKTTFYLALVILIGILIGLRIQVGRGRGQQLVPRTI